MTRRDAFWGAKMVMSFSDEDLRAIVETGRLSNPEAEAHLLEVLKKRRDKVGRYWFDRINPLDRFSVTDSSMAVVERGGATPVGSPLQFDDLAVTGDLAVAEARRYTYRFFLDGEALGPVRSVDSSRVPLGIDGRALGTVLDARDRTAPDDRVVRVDLRTVQGDETSSVTQVYVVVPMGAPARVVGVHRE
jgi:hypothetical protein